MPQMFRNLSIRPKMVVLLAVPVAGTALLGVTGVAGAWGDRPLQPPQRPGPVGGQRRVHPPAPRPQLALAALAGRPGVRPDPFLLQLVDGHQRLAGQGELGARRRRVDAAAAAYRAGALRRLERTVAGDLDAAALASLRQRERRLRDRQVLAGVAVLATLVAASLLLRVLGRREMLARAAPGAAVPGLARRGQALADRQLQLLEDLVRDEPDPLRREGLLGVDHLATRLRRTAETLLAVTGPDPARRSTRPLPVSTLLLAAIAEAEPGGSGREGAPATPDGSGGRGRRVEILTTGDAEVAGAAGIDLVHLLAELLDNAVAFSPPTAPIVVTGGADGDGYLIEVTDRGLGMSTQEQAWANHRLASAAGDPGGDQAAADRLGLLVVARLARRNGFRVRLRSSSYGGVTAAVRLPAAQRPAPAAAPVRAS